MSQSDGADHWAELASQLGADLPAAESSSLQAVAETGPSAGQDPGSTAGATAGALGEVPVSSPSGPKPEMTKPVAKPAKRKPISAPPTRSAADWDLLAEELGIAPRPTSPEGSLGKIASRVELFDAPEPPAAEAPGAGTPPMELDGGSIRDQRAVSAGQPPRGEPAAAFASTESPPSARSSTTSAPRGGAEDESRGGSAAELAGFGAGLFEVEPPARRKAHEEAESKTAEPRSKRRRRRKKKVRGLNGSAASDTAAAAEPCGEASIAEDAKDADRAPDSPSSRTPGDVFGAPVERGRSARPEDAAPRREPAEHDGSDEEDDDKESRFIHRGVPTWSEAIGLIIDANMEARAKRPNGTGGSRGRGGRRNRNAGHKN